MSQITYFFPAGQWILDAGPSHSPNGIFFSVQWVEILKMYWVYLFKEIPEIPDRIRCCLKVREKHNPTWLFNIVRLKQPSSVYMLSFDKWENGKCKIPYRKTSFCQMSFSVKGAKKLKLPTELKAEQNHQHFKFELRKSSTHDCFAVMCWDQVGVGDLVGSCYIWLCMYVLIRVCPMYVFCLLC